MRFGPIVDGIVANVALATPEFAASQGWVELPSEVSIGWRYEGGKFLPPDAPTTPPAPFSSISDRQFFQALAMQPYAIITTQEALDAVKTGEIPQVMQAVIDTLPADQQFGATMILAGGTSYERGHPLVAAFGASRGMDTAAVDAFWRFAEGL